MNVYKFVVSLSQSIGKAYSIKELDVDIISELQNHQKNFNWNHSQKAVLTVYFSKVNQYNDYYRENLSEDNNAFDLYKKEVETQIRTVIRAFGIDDRIYEVEVKLHHNAYC